MDGETRKQGRVLVVDEEPAVRQVVGRLLSSLHHVSVVASRDAAVHALQQQSVELLLLGDMGEPGNEELCREARRLNSRMPIFVFGSDEPSAQTLIELGATGSLQKSLLQTESGRIQLLVHLDRAIFEHRQQGEVAFRRRLNRRAALAGKNLLIGASPATSALRDEIIAAGNSDLNLVLTGETGVGKSLVAESVHDASEARRNKPYVVVDPSTLPAALFESELFGHVRGAFTGATTAQVGAFEAAAGGTLFLDEIGDLPPPLQVKLLRAVETKKVRRLGDHRETRLDVRIIAATNRDLEAEVEARRFRADLFQRLNEIRFHIPPLRRRRDDIIPLFEHLLGEATLGAVLSSIDRGAARALTEYSWPGNVRELRTLARRLVDRGLPPVISEATLVPLFPARLGRDDGTDLSPEEQIAIFSRRVYLAKLQRYDFDIREAAAALGLAYGTLRSRLEKLDLLDIVKERRQQPDRRQV